MLGRNIGEKGACWLIQPQRALAGQTSSVAAEGGSGVWTEGPIRSEGDHKWKVEGSGQPDWAGFCYIGLHKEVHRWASEKVPEPE